MHVGLGVGLTTGLMAALLLGVLLLQLSRDRYVPWIYWLSRGAAERGRHPDHRHPDRYPGCEPVREHGRVQLATGGLVLVVVSRRRHPVDQRDRHAPTRTLLLGRRPCHVCARHSRGRSRHRSPRPRLPARRAGVRRPHRRHRGGVACRHQRRSCVLARLHPHAPTRCLARRSAGAGARVRRPGIWHRGHERLVPGCHRRVWCSQSACHAGVPPSDLRNESRFLLTSIES